MPLNEGEDSPADLPLFGDIVLCAPVVAREAAEQGKTLHAHYAHLTVHGVLHPAATTILDDSEAEAMEALETVILAKVRDTTTLTPNRLTNLHYGRSWQ